MTEANIWAVVQHIIQTTKKNALLALSASVADSSGSSGSIDSDSGSNDKSSNENDELEKKGWILLEECVSNALISRHPSPSHGGVRESRRESKSHLMDLAGNEIKNNIHIETVFNDSLNSCKKRKQVKLNTDHDLVKIAKEGLPNSILKGHIINECALLYSKSGCLKQQYHTDYDPALHCFKNAELKPLSVLLAIDSGTKLYMKKCATDDDEILVRLNPGDILVFKGDTVHAGADYASPNIRMHMYLDVPGIKRNSNTTHLCDSPP